MREEVTTTDASLVPRSVVGGVLVALGVAAVALATADPGRAQVGWWLGAGAGGVLVGVLRLQPIVSTFAAGIVFGGIALWIMPQAGGSMPPVYAKTYAATGFARDVLSVADNLSRALAAIPAELKDDEKFKGLVTGLEATGRELDSVFARHGISKIVALGEALDPNRHQAMMEVPSADAEPGTIVQEIQSGYMIRDRLLRPALVGVAKKAD